MRALEDTKHPTRNEEQGLHVTPRERRESGLRVGHLHSNHRSDSPTTNAGDQAMLAKVN